MDRMSTAGNDEGEAAASILRRPIEDGDVAWRRAGQVSTIGIFVIALTWVMYAAQHVVIPVLLAWTIATVVLPIVKGLETLRKSWTMASSRHKHIGGLTDGRWHSCRSTPHCHGSTPQRLTRHVRSCDYRL